MDSTRSWIVKTIQKILICRAAAVPAGANLPQSRALICQCERLEHMEATWARKRIALQKKHGSVFGAGRAGPSAREAQPVPLPGSQTRRSTWGRRGRASRRRSTRRSGRTAASRPRRTRWTGWPPGEASGRGTCGSDLRRTEEDVCQTLTKARQSTESSTFNFKSVKNAETNVAALSL